MFINVRFTKVTLEPLSELTVFLFQQNLLADLYLLNNKENLQNSSIILPYMSTVFRQIGHFAEPIVLMLFQACYVAPTFIG